MVGLQYSQMARQLLEETLIVTELYLNGGHKYIIAILSKYLNQDWWRLMDQKSNRNTPYIKYHHDRYNLGILYYIYLLQEAFATLEAAV